jgi:GST-like protein
LLALAGASCELESYPFELLGPGCNLERLLAQNPLGQMPTLVLEDGQVLTETAAIARFLSERFPQAALAPPPGHPDRAAFLRWLVFLGSPFYATFTYGDFPERWVQGREAAVSLERSTLAHRQKLWCDLEQHAVRGPFFLGNSFSALDVFISVMSRWRPRRAWLAEHCPKLSILATQLDQHPLLVEIWARNFGNT